MVLPMMTRIKPQKRWHLDDITAVDHDHGAYTLQVDITDDLLERELELVVVHDMGVFDVRDPAVSRVDALEIERWLDTSAVAARLLRDAIECYSHGR